MATPPEDDPWLSDDPEDRTQLAPVRAQMRARGPRATFTLPEGDPVEFSGTAILGRKPHPDARAGQNATLVAIADDSRSVSKNHLMLRVDEDGVAVTDLGSTNGTLVTLPDGQQVLCEADQEVKLPAGAVVTLGPISIEPALVVESTGRGTDQQN